MNDVDSLARGIVGVDEFAEKIIHEASRSVQKKIKQVRGDLEAGIAIRFVAASAHVHTDSAAVRRKKYPQICAPAFRKQHERDTIDM